MKFRTRLFLFYVIGIGLMLLILASYFTNFEEGRIRQTLHQQLLTQAKLISGRFESRQQLQDRPKLDQVTAQAAQAAESRVTIIDRTGKVLEDSAENPYRMENHADRPEVKEALEGRPGTTTRYSDTLGTNMIYTAVPIVIDKKIVGVVRVAQGQNRLDQMLFRLRVLIAGGIAVTALLAFVIGLTVMRQISQPILELERLATGIAKGDLTGRVRFFGRDELADLGLAFNSMAQQLSDSFALIEEEKRKLEVILENLADGILVIDQKLRVVLANPAAQAMLQLDPKNITGRPVMEAVLNHHLLDLIQDVNRYKEPQESELAVHFPSNRLFQIFLAPLKDTPGRVVGTIVVLHDLTQIRRLERVRQDFVANVSHELRTPITSVKAMAETLLNGGWKESEMLLRYLRAIDQECDRLSNLINDLLALARLDSKAEVVKEPFDIVGLFHEVKERFEPLAGRTPHFELNLPQTELPGVSGNRNQIKQVLINLLDNAFKYTPAEGQVRLSAWREGDMLRVAVADTGVGIPTRDLDRIFERFYRVDKARSREMGGTGLGLSIVKHIVESHGGKVKVDSSLNQGSVFSFTIPVSEAYL